jgi:hypothetical protein
VRRLWPSDARAHAINMGRIKAQSAAGNDHKTIGPAAGEPQVKMAERITASLLGAQARFRAGGCRYSYGHSTPKNDRRQSFQDT